jgi:ubiquinone/menaquinone biosynthesis C-methylase UbiE
MVASDKVFAGSIPELYDTYLVPLIFEAYAEDLARKIARAAPRRILETAAGSGVLTRALAAQLPESVRMVATDLNQPMLDHAIRRLPDARVEWKQADALDLPFQDQSFDVVACQFGAMFFPDKVQAYKEARRVLKTGGRYFLRSPIARVLRSGQRSRLAMHHFWKTQLPKPPRPWLSGLVMVWLRAASGRL